MFCRRMSKNHLSRGSGWTDLASTELCGFCVFSICRRRPRLNGNATAGSGRICLKTVFPVFSCRFMSATVRLLKMPMSILRESKHLCLLRDRLAFFASPISSSGKFRFFMEKRRSLCHRHHLNWSCFRIKLLP